MKNWFRFIIGNKRLLNYGFMFNFFSSFGQTFFISLFLPFWVESTGISNAAFGTLYASVTIVSAVLLTLTGKYIDYMPLKRYSTLAFIGLLFSVLLLSVAHNLVLLALALLLVRWFGQGLMTHTAATGIARFFDINRGKALGFTALGHPAGQFILPIIVMPMIINWGWRASLITLAAISAIIVFPTLQSIKPVTPFVTISSKKQSNEAKPDQNYFKSINFWIIAANSFILPFLLTAVFLYQYQIGQNNGWDVSWVAFSFSFYAIFNAVSLLASGSLVDRYTGVFLFPLYLIPAIIGLALMAATGNKWSFPIFYSLLGIASGLGSTIKTAMQVEVYGKGNLGKIRSYFSTLLVISTALGPPAFGYLIDKEFTFSSIMAMLTVVLIAIFLISFKLWSKRITPILIPD